MFDDVIVAIPNAQLEGVENALARAQHEQALVAAAVMDPVSFPSLPTVLVTPDADFVLNSSSSDISPVAVMPLEERNRC